MAPAKISRNDESETVFYSREYTGASIRLWKPKNTSSFSCTSTENLTRLQSQERNILKEIFLTANGLTWINSTNWNSSLPHCNCWYGISCYERGPYKGLIQEIFNNVNNMTGFLPKSIWNLKGLQIIYMSQNRLRGNLEHFLVPNVPMLTELDFAFNSIYGIVPWNVLATWPNLTKIQLCNNYVHGPISVDIEKLTNLQVLSIGETEINGTIPQNIMNLKQLWFLELTRLRLRGNFSFFLPLTNLKYIHVSGNQLVGELPSSVSRWYPFLVELIVSNNSLEGELPNDFDGTTNLTVLDVNRNRMFGTVPSTIMNHTNLLYLDVSHNQFTDLSSFVRLPKIKLLNFGSNPFNLSVENFTSTLCHSPQRETLAVVDFSSTGMHGRFLKQIWLMTNIFVLDLSNNSLSGELPNSAVMLFFMQYLDFSDNNLNGSVPYGLTFPHVMSMNFHNNAFMSGGEHLLPWYAKPDYSVMIKERHQDRFTCPLIRLAYNKHGTLTVNSSYYKRQLCYCDEGYYGHRGMCSLCPEGGSCQGESHNNTIKMSKNHYPSPSPRNASTLIRCNYEYKNFFPCNPRGNCTCWLSDSLENFECDESCLCSPNHRGRLCSLCDDQFYHDGQKCVRCINRTLGVTAIAAVVASVVLLSATIWLLTRLCPSLRERRAFRVFKILAILFESCLLLLLAFLDLVPTYIAEIYFLTLIVATFGRLHKAKVHVMILVVYAQILGSLKVTDLRVDCEYCSFVAILNKAKVYSVAKAIGHVINFNFAGLACTLPFLLHPLPKLLVIASLPFVIGIVFSSIRWLDYILLSCRLKDREKRRLLSQAAKRSSARNFIFLLNVFYFPISASALEILQFCEKDIGDGESYMKAFPWIRCSSSEHITLVSVAALIVAVYVVSLPVFFYIVLYRNFNCHRSDVDTSVVSDLSSPYRSPFNKYASVVFMIRRLGLACFLTLFTYELRDVQAIFINVWILGFGVFVNSCMPYRSSSEAWKVENFVDIAAFGAVLVTYNCMTAREIESEAGAGIVVAINGAFLLFMATVPIVEIVKAWRKRKEESYLEPLL
ncbi:putative leucine-rich repeat-containing protein DDB_G0281931 isoform X2 [Oscarella lobularis]